MCAIPQLSTKYATHWLSLSYRRHKMKAHFVCDNCAFLRLSQKNDFTQPLFLAVICKEIADHKEPQAGKKSEKRGAASGSSWRRQLRPVSTPPNTPHPIPTSTPTLQPHTPPPISPHPPPTPTHPLTPPHTHSQCYLWHQLTVVNFIITTQKIM